MATSKGGAKGKASEDAGGGVLYARVGPEMLEALDKWAEKLNAKGGPRWTRQDVVKAALTRALEERGKKGETP